jgi:hypothetical protein
MELLKQEYGYGCGVYSIANALNYADFITDERLEQSKCGNNVGQLTKWLNDDGHNMFIDTIKYTGRLISLPKMWWRLDETCAYFPMLISVPATRTINHMIAIKGYPEWTLPRSEKAPIEVCDSLLDEPFWMESWDDLKKKYPKVYGLFCFRNFENKELFMLK